MQMAILFYGLVMVSGRSTIRYVFCLYTLAELIYMLLKFYARLNGLMLLLKSLHFCDDYLWFTSLF